MLKSCRGWKRLCFSQRYTSHSSYRTRRWRQRNSYHCQVRLSTLSIPLILMHLSYFEGTTQATSSTSVSQKNNTPQPIPKNPSVSSSLLSVMMLVWGRPRVVLLEGGQAPFIPLPFRILTIFYGRGLAGTVIVYKIAGALASRGVDLDSVYDVAEWVSQRLGTVGVGLEHCHVSVSSLPSFQSTHTFSDPRHDSCVLPPLPHLRRDRYGNPQRARFRTNLAYPAPQRPHLYPPRSPHIHHGPGTFLPTFWSARLRER